MIRFARVVSGGVGIVLTAAALVAATRPVREGLPFYQDATLTPEWVQVARGDTTSIHRIGNFALTDQDGRRVTATDVRGKVYVASFFFTECRQLCPRLRTNLAQVQAAFRKDTGVMILSHTVNPEADDTAALSRYARVNGVRSPQWRLLTGSRSEIARLAREAYFVELSDTTGNTQGLLRHTETVVLVDALGRIRGVYDGSVSFDVERLIDDIRVLRPSGGRRATP